MLKRKVPVNRVGSCGITVTRDRRISRLTFDMSTPSIKIVPVSSSTSLDKVKPSVDFPAPVRPTTPTFMPGSALKVRFLITKSVFGR